MKKETYIVSDISEAVATEQRLGLKFLEVYNWVGDGEDFPLVYLGIQLGDALVGERPGYFFWFRGKEAFNVTPLVECEEVSTPLFPKKNVKYNLQFHQPRIEWKQVNEGGWHIAEMGHITFVIQSVGNNEWKWHYGARSSKYFSSLDECKEACEKDFFDYLEKGMRPLRQAQAEIQSID